MSDDLKPMTDEALARATEIVDNAERHGPSVVVHTCVASELLDEVLRLREEAEKADTCKCGEPRAESCLACAGW